MTRTHHRHVLAVLAASALALTACSSSEDAQEQTAATGAESSAENNKPKRGKNPFKQEFTAADLDTLEEVPAENFTPADSVYKVAFPGSDLGNCIVPTAETMSSPIELAEDKDPSFLCDTGKMNEEDVSEALRGQADYLHGGFSYHPAAGFLTKSAIIPRPDLETAEPAGLNTGERVTLNGFTIARPEDNTLLVVRGEHSATAGGGKTSITSPYQKILEEGGNSLDKEQPAEETAAQEGAICGSYPYSQDGRDGAIVGIAVAADTDCVGVMEAAKPYLEQLNSETGTVDWTSPDGWECTVGFKFPESTPEDIGDPICQREGAGSATLALLFPEDEVEQ